MLTRKDLPDVVLVRKVITLHTFYCLFMSCCLDSVFIIVFLPRDSKIVFIYSSQCYKTKGERRWLLKSMQFDESAPQTNKEQAAAEGDYEVRHPITFCFT